MIGLGEDGAYTAYGKDRDGVTGRLRADDGIHFTAAGYELIAQKIIGTQGSVGRMRNKCGPGPGRAIGRAGLLRTGVLAICALLSLMSGPLLLENAAASAPLVILVLGDSLTAGLGVPREAAFPAQLEARLRAQGTEVRVVDKGISGDTTAGGLARVDRALAEKPDLVVLELGANDALRGIQPAVVRANLDAMITKVLASGTRLLLTGMRAPLNWGEDYRAAFDRIYPDLARLRRVPLYPFFLQGVAQDPQLNQPDRLHPNESGVHVLVDRIAPVLEHLTEDQGNGEIPVATDKGVVWMGEQEYREFTRGLESLPVLSGSYVFGSIIPRPSTLSFSLSI